LIITEKFIGTVKNNTDPQKKGRVQIDIPEIFIGNIPDDDLPWAKQDRGSSSDIPEENDKVWCYWHDGKFESEIKSKLSGFSSTYPDVKFKYLPNGNCMGMTSGDNAEIFIVNKNGSLIFLKSDGSMIVQDKNGHAIEIDATGITLNTGDASSWAANSLAIDPFSGVKHSLITKLKGK
jgi:hypothetical protein